MRIGSRRLLPALLCGSLLALAIIAPLANAQTTAPNEWTWMGGSSTITCPSGAAQCRNYAASTGVYGTLGVAAPGNIPGSREGAAYWTDSSGNLWLFGGYIGGEMVGNLNDLWEFNPSTNEWTWVGGSKSAFPPGVYGSLGTSAAGNIPGGRHYASFWKDTSGNVWLFGGEGQDASGKFGLLNDLWEFSPSTKEWAWMGGSKTVNDKGYSPASYGTLGTGAAGNIPGGRNKASSWIDSSGNLWLSGGYGYDANGRWDFLNDLWEFNPSTNEWAWMGGSSKGGQAGVYGTLGTPATGNIPAGHYESMNWTDNNGNFWLFGGDGTSVLWEFNPSTKEWMWVAGNISGVQSPIYGTLGTPAPGNDPGGRFGASSWYDNSGNVWLFGDGAGNDFWGFNPTTYEWTWVGGSSKLTYFPVFGFWGTTGVYGTLGTPGAGNIPAGRSGGACWTDSSGNLWLFGGFGWDSSGNNGWLNDLWVYQPYVNAATPVISTPTGTYSTYQTITITDTTPGATIYYTADGSTPTVLSTKYTGAITVSTSETIRAIAVAANYVNSAVASATYTIGLPQVATPTFTPAGGATFTSLHYVNITDATPNATIYYTTDGSTPTINSTKYTSAIAVLNTETIKAIAVASGYSDSAVASATYTMNLSPDFSIYGPGGSYTVTAGQSVRTAIMVTALNGFASPVSFSCSGLPSGATCSFSPESVTPNEVVRTVLTVTTSATSAALHRNSNPLLPGLALAVAFCCLGWRKRRRLQMLLLLAVSLAGFSILNGCGGGGSGGSTHQPVVSTVTVTATSGSLSHSTTFVLTVN